MKGLLQFWLVAQGIVIFLVFGAVASAFTSTFGEYSAEAFWTILAGIIVLALYLNIRSIIGSKRDANDIILDANDGIDGPFEQWFENQDRWAHGDHIPLRKVPRLAARAYHGLDRIALLLREGFGGIIQDDLVAVLGDERGFLALRDLSESTQRADIKFSLLGFLVGMKIGHDIVRK